MKHLKWIGAVLIVLGIATWLFPEISFTREETVVDLGPLMLKGDRKHVLHVPQAVALGMMALGAVALLIGFVRSK